MKRIANRVTLILVCLSCLPFGWAQQLQTHTRYLLRPGDMLELKYRLTPDLDQTVTVEPDGFVSVNAAGEVRVGGLTVSQAHDLIVQRESEKLNAPELEIVLKEFTRPAIVIAGQVSRPGRLELKEPMTAYSAVLNSGGFTDDAQTGHVLVFRKVNDAIAEVRKLDLSKMNRTADLEHDMQLEPGDMIYVPRDKIARFKHYMSVTNMGLYFNPVDVFR